MWLTGNKIIEEVNSGKILINPFIRENINSNSYNYTLNPTILRLTSKIIDLKVEDEYEEITISEDGYILLPGECYLGCTNEVFRSDYYASLVTGRSSIGRKFITNHITAGLIDQGFEGTITLEIVVTKPTKIYPNVKFGQIFWFSTLGDALLYNLNKGKYMGQNKPTLSKIGVDFEKNK